MDSSVLETFPGISNIIGKKGLKLGHINVNGLENKLSEIKILLKESNLHVLAIAETHLSEATEDSKIAIEGYLFIRNDRKGKGNNWGGTLIYYKEHIDIYELKYEQSF